MWPFKCFPDESIFPGYLTFVHAANIALIDVHEDLLQMLKRKLPIALIMQVLLPETDYM